MAVPTSFTPRSVVLVGMRGVGKSFLGRSAAAALGWQLLDLDDVLCAQTGKTCAELVAAEGWHGFRARESALLVTVLREHPHKTVIACGGGIVETPAARRALQAHTPVVHVERAIQDIARELGDDGGGSGDADAGGQGSGAKSGDGHRPAYADGESLEAAWARRRPWYQRASTHHFFVHRGDGQWRTITRDFVRFLKSAGVGNLHTATCEVPRCLVDGTATRPASMVMPRLRRGLSNGTYFVCLTYPDIEGALDQLPAVCSGVDAVEVRVDRLKSMSPAFVLSQLALLRRVVSLPVIFTVRSVAHGGSFGGSQEEQMELLQLGVRAGCEYVDVEAHSAAFVQKLHAVRGASRLVVSVHVPQPPAPDAAGLAHLFAAAYCGGLADVVKVVVPCATLGECLTLRRVADEAAAKYSDCMVVAIGTCCGGWVPSLCTSAAR